MALKGKHNVAEIDGIRCSVVESGISKERSEFLSELLSHNGYAVKIGQEKEKDGTLLETFQVGVTDILFNPVIMIYMNKLFRKDGNIVSPGYWEQKSTDTEMPYYMA